MEVSREFVVLAGLQLGEQLTDGLLHVGEFLDDLSAFAADSGRRDYPDCVGLCELGFAQRCAGARGSRTAFSSRHEGIKPSKGIITQTGSLILGPAGFEPAAS
jgi:hypothetical protein